MLKLSESEQEFLLFFHNELPIILISILKKYHPFFISLHFSHPDEITDECAKACNKLADGGFPLGSQTVLLKGINDNVPTMKELMHRLLKIQCKTILSLSM